MKETNTNKTLEKMTTQINTPLIPTQYSLEKEKVGFSEIKKDTFYNHIAEQVNVAIGELKYRLIHKAEKDQAEKETAELCKEDSTYHGSNIYDPNAGTEEECYL